MSTFQEFPFGRFGCLWLAEISAQSGNAPDFGSQTKSPYFPLFWDMIPISQPATLRCARCLLSALIFRICRRDIPTGQSVRSMCPVKAKCAGWCLIQSSPFPAAARLRGNNKEINTNFRTSRDTLIKLVRSDENPPGQLSKNQKQFPINSRGLVNPTPPNPLSYRNYSSLTNPTNPLPITPYLFLRT